MADQKQQSDQNGQSSEKKEDGVGTGVPNGAASGSAGTDPTKHRGPLADAYRRPTIIGGRRLSAGSPVTPDSELEDDSEQHEEVLPNQTSARKSAATSRIQILSQAAAAILAPTGGVSAN